MIIQFALLTRKLADLILLRVGLRVECMMVFGFLHINIVIVITNLL